MSDLVERLKIEASWWSSEYSSCGEAVARITELEAEVDRLKQSRREMYEAGFNDGLTGVYSATATDPVWKINNLKASNHSASGFEIDPLRAQFHEPVITRLMYVPIEEV